MVKAVLLSLLLPTLFLGAVPTLTRPVTDQTESLSARETETVAQALVKLRTEQQVQMAVLLVDSTNGQPIEDFSEEVFRTWKGGEKGRDNGVLLVIAKGDRRSRLEVGYGLEAELTDGEAQSLLHAQGPLLREGRFDAALLAIIAGVSEQAPGSFGLHPPGTNWPYWAVSGFFLTLVVFAFVAAGLLIQCRLSALRGMAMPVVAAMLVLIPPVVLVSVAWDSQMTLLEILVVYVALLAVFLGGWFVARKWSGWLGGVLLAGILLGALACVMWPPSPTARLGSLLAWTLFLSIAAIQALALILAVVKGISAAGSGDSSSSSWATSSSSSSSTDWSSSYSSSSYDSSSSYSSSDSSSSSSDWSGGGGSSGGGGGSDSW
ncbi:TPM domain-containing protein [Corallococcus sp. bb12-1]|uniref:TPM domain-containing protein n=1 Tax=Corallococcus sp. bb12-1 TaxID=2996784 RepID=UPI0022706B16|nr:TPM domain-containing protein [Corallococcus sp. bb12-1]MCY1043593.1 TPM domain-containing protein [Corallococcus sp. bb12-1]